MGYRRLLVMGASALAVVLAAGCASPEQKLERYTKSGEKFLAEDDIGRANIQFRNALKIDEDHLPALRGLYKISESKNNTEQMYALLSAIVRLDPADVYAQTQLSKIHLLSNNEEDAMAAVDAVLAIEPENAEAKAVKAAIRFRYGDRVEAVTLAEEALAADPTIQEAATVLATNKVLEEDYDAAVALIDETLAVNSEAAVLHLLKIEIFGRQNRDADIDAAYAALIDAFPDEPAYRRLFVSRLYRSKRYEEARGQFMAIIENEPDNVDAHIEVVRIDLKTGGVAKARQTLDYFVAEKPDQIDLVFALGSFIRQHDSGSDARAIYEGLLSHEDPAVQLRAKNEIAQMLLDEEKPAEAKTLIDEILVADERNSGALAKNAGLKILDGDFDGAISDLRVVLSDSPELIQPQLLLATAYERSGEVAAADAQFTTALENPRTRSQVSREFAQFLIRQEQTDRAGRILIDALEGDPNDEENLKLLAAVRLQQQDWRGAEEVAQRIQNLDPDADAVGRILGVAYNGLKDYSGAIKVLSEQNDDSPLSFNPLSVLISAYVNSDRRQEAIDLLRDNIAKDPTNYDARLLLARVLNGAGKPEEARAALREAVSVEAENPAAYELLFRIYDAQGLRDDAIDVIDQGLASVEEKDGLLVLKADRFIRDGNLTGALAIYEDILVRRPGDLLVSNNFAAITTEIKDDQESLQKAVNVAAVLADSENANFLDTYGWALVRVGRVDEGVAVLERAARLAPSFADVLLHLGDAQIQAGDREAGEETLNKLIELAAGKRPEMVEKARALLAG